jgi:hypothetical protein
MVGPSLSYWQCSELRYISQLLTIQLEQGGEDREERPSVRTLTAELINDSADASCVGHERRSGRPQIAKVWGPLQKK